jgi:Fic family protein
MFDPVFRITPAIAKSLMSIEASREAVAALPVDVAMLTSLRETARLRATHYSTQIEGNRLTEVEVKAVVLGAHVPGRERDVHETGFLAVHDPSRKNRSYRLGDAFEDLAEPRVGSPRVARRRPRRR